MLKERAYRVGGAFTLRDLRACLPGGGRIVPLAPVTLIDTYHDTADLRLTRSGAALWHHDGDPLLEVPGGEEHPTPAWTLRLPGPAPTRGREIPADGPRPAPPGELVRLAAAYHRGAPLGTVALVRTVRRAYELRDADDRLLVEVLDDAGATLAGRRVRGKSRQVRLSADDRGGKVAEGLARRLRTSGAVAATSAGPDLRVLGPVARRPPDLVPPGALGRRPRAEAVVTSAIRGSIAAIFGYDPLVRLHSTVGRNDTAVHRMRTACRRLRSDLRTFAPLLDADWAEHLRGELGWLAAALGAARDAEVLRERLRRTASADPLATLDGAAVDRLEGDLVGRHEEALKELDAVLASDRYLKLLDALVDAARAPRLGGAAKRPAARVLPGLVRRPYQKLARGGDHVPGAGALDPTGPDESWHAVRIRGKRARYAVEAVAAALGGAAPKLSRALRTVQNLLGEHQDAAVAADTWLSAARAHPDDPALALAAGRLYERERAAVRAVRARFPAAWRAASTGTVVRWLR